MRNWILLVMVVSFGLVLAACGSTTVQINDDGVGKLVSVDGGGDYIDITPQDLKSMMDEKDFYFVNVHIPYEGEIPDTDAFIAFDEVILRLGEFPSDADSKIVLYCRSGSMSTTAARELVKAGYTNIFNLDGGFRAWSQAGFEFIQ